MTSGRDRHRQRDHGPIDGDAKRLNVETLIDLVVADAGGDQRVIDLGERRRDVARGRLGGNRYIDGGVVKLTADDGGGTFSRRCAVGHQVFFEGGDGATYIFSRQALSQARTASFGKFARSTNSGSSENRAQARRNLPRSLQFSLPDSSITMIE